jgi:hypothetical protein
MGEAQYRQIFAASVIAILLRNFLLRANRVYEAASVNAPFLLSMALEIRQPLIAAYPSEVGGYEEAGPINPGEYLFPCMQVVDPAQVDDAIRPLCDQANQMFGRRQSLQFDGQGH